MIWFFIGDVIGWLEDGSNISGVQRVAIELLHAASELAETDRRFRIGVLTLDTDRRDLLGIPLRDTVNHLRRWRSGAPVSPAPSASRGAWRPRLADGIARLFGRRTPDLARPGAAPIAVPVTFGDTDHLLFPGLVWSPHFQALFRRLSAEGRKFTVLIHDLIQIQRPDLVGEAASTEFAAWLAVVLRTATSILVPSVVTREAILAWARDGGFGTLPPIVALRFGMSHLASAPTEPPGRGVRVGNYVLSVGTIDRRKNQHMLIDAWNELIAGPQAVPQLVLAGRLDLPGLGDGARRLMAQDDLVIVQDATDAELAALYANCRFTLFPSLAEGFGLPVAESLRFGKVCVASALPEIREFAGDFVWYFPPGSLDGALGQIRRAIGSPDDLAAQERAIATGFVAPSWSDAIRQIRDVIGR